MGFGLAISKRFIEAHGGSISVVSNVGRGTTVTITIPARAKIVCDVEVFTELPEQSLPPYQADETEPS
jgi:chemotaxis protein histidine kinase CheA